MGTTARQVNQATEPGEINDRNEMHRREQARQSKHRGKQWNRNWRHENTDNGNERQTTDR